MKHEAVLRIKFCSPAEAELANHSLEPDNKPLPSYLRLDVERTQEELVYRVSCIDRPIQTLLSTLDDIIRALILVEPIVCVKLGEERTERQD
ncbi:MAG: KEOPS complex subunit Pcc1 [Nitrososphaerota archaeon]|nr:KEOPS complex subunit Pcc1 [Candidatus Calditenuaceae archaeon]MDW8073238.1 KEOPS complex subunit Pcc1 [Nitrososphaerota archaeon]